MSNKLYQIRTIVLVTSLLMFGVAANAQTSQNAQDNNADQTSKPKKINAAHHSRPRKATATATGPSLEDRLDTQRQAVRRGEKLDASKPYMIDELTVTGIFKSGDGYGAFLKAVNGKTFFASVGMPFYDGQVIQIDSDQVVFQQELPGGKHRQLVKAYDPAAIRTSKLQKDEEDEDNQETHKKKKKTKDSDDDDDNKKNKDRDDDDNQ